MATYPRGVNNFIPSYQPFDLDWNVLARNVQLKQTRYDQNWERLNNIYGSLYNSQVSNPESMKVRENLLRQIDFDVRRVAGMDLSLKSNVAQASQIFQPFYENKNLIADIVKTSDYNKAMAYGQGLKTSKNKDERDMYWGGGFEYLNNRMDEFKALSFNELSSFGSFEYEPYVNIEKLSSEITKDMGDMTIEYKNGRYIYKDTNGNQIIGTLNDVLQSRLGSDPNVQKYYSVLEYNNRKRHIRQNMSENPDLNEEQAEYEYLKTKVPGLMASQKRQKLVLENGIKSTKEKIKSLKSSIAKGKNSPDAELQLNDLQQYLAGQEKSLSVISNNMGLLDGDADNKTDLTSGAQEVDYQDLSELRNRIIPSEVQGMINADLLGAAERYSRRNMSRTMRADPYAQIDYQSASSLNLHKQKELFDAWLENGYVADSKGNLQYVPILDKVSRQKLKQNAATMAANEKAVHEQKVKDGTEKKVVQTNADGTEEVVYVPNLENTTVNYDPSRKTESKQTDPGKIVSEVEKIYRAGAEKNITNVTAETIQELYDSGLIDDQDVLRILSSSTHKGIAPGEPGFGVLLGDEDTESTTEFKDNMHSAYMALGQGVMGRNRRTRSGLSSIDGTEETAEWYNDLYKTDKQDVKFALDIVKENLKNMQPVNMARMFDELQTTIAPYSPENYPTIQKLQNNLLTIQDAQFALGDYLDTEVQTREYLTERRKQIQARLIQKGFNKDFTNLMFNDKTDMIITGEEFSNELHKKYSDRILEPELWKTTSTTGSRWTNAIAGATTGAGLAIAAGQAGPQILSPEELITVPVSALGGFVYGWFFDEAVGAIKANVEGDYGPGSEDVLDPSYANRNWYNFASQNVTVEEEYDNMVEAIDEIIEDQLVAPPIIGLNPSGIPGGAGTFNTGSTFINLLPGVDTYPNQLFWTEINPMASVAVDSPEGGFFTGKDDLKDMTVFSTKGIDAEDAFDSAYFGYYDPYEGADLGSGAKLRGFNDARSAFKKIHADLQNGLKLDKKDSPFKKVRVDVADVGAGQFERVSVTYTPDDDYLKKTFSDEDLIENIRNNGVSAMIPKSQIDNIENVTMIAGAYMDPGTARVRRTGSVTYSDYKDPDNWIRFSLSDPSVKYSPIEVTSQYKIWQNGKYVTVEGKPQTIDGRIDVIRKDFLSNTLNQVRRVSQQNYQNEKLTGNGQ